ncbi:MAG: alpha/beta hydrolase [Nocardiaceae bacterium]|nr:alpha/beta hydrolase [Nocardiaceae bacterium]
MPIRSLPSGAVEYREYGPVVSSRPPVLFVHGVLVDYRLWEPVAQRLAAAGYRCIAPTWPLGSHRVAWGPDADRTPRGAARLISEFIADLGLTDVTLVGNDTGGALCQYVMHEYPDAVGRVVLTNCDAFDIFPPQPFKLLFSLARNPAMISMLLAPMHLRFLRHSPLGYGLLITKRDPKLTNAVLKPAQTDRAIRADLAAFAKAIDPAELAKVTPALRGFTKPVSIVWGMADRAFTPKMGRRLAEVLPNATFTEVPGARTFVSLDQPVAVFEAITALSSSK